MNNRYITILAFLLAVCEVQSQPFSLRLPSSPYAAGFKTYWKNDPSRWYDASGLDSTLSRRSARPILLYVWYPTSRAVAGKKMSYGRYLQPPRSAIAGRIQEVYSRYNLQTASRELLGKEEAQLKTQERLLFKEVLNTATLATLNAHPLQGKFPLVIYHPGNGASLDDNVLFCEWLAANGYVVISSSFFDEAGLSWGVDGAMGSVRDISFILSHIGEWEPLVDLQNIAVMGHSAGAQAAHMVMAQGNLVCKAMVSLETTEEYFTLADKRWKKFLVQVLTGIDKVRGDALFLAKPGAIFQLADSMRNANRYYATIPEVAHNNFISQGVVHTYLQALLKQTTNAEKESHRVADDYRNICELVLHFLNAKLKGKEAPFAAMADSRMACMDYKNACIERMTPGNTSPDTYVSESMPPTIRQFRRVVAANIDEALRLLVKFSVDSPRSGIYDAAYAFAIIDELMEQDRQKDAVLLYKTYERLSGAAFTDHYKWMCDFFSMFSKEIGAACSHKRQLLMTGEVK